MGLFLSLNDVGMLGQVHQQGEVSQHVFMVYVCKYMIMC